MWREVCQSENMSALNNDGIQFYKVREYDEALSCFHRALLLATINPNVQSKLSGCESTSSSSTTGHVGYHEKRIDFDEGMRYFTEPQHIPSNQCLDSEIVKASILFNIGIVYSKSNQEDEAEAYFQKSFSIIKVRESIFLLTENLKFQGPQALAVLHNIGYMQFKLNKYKDSVKTYIQILFSTRDGSSHDCSSFDAASALNCLGVALSYLALSKSSTENEKYLKEADCVLHEALAIRKAHGRNLEIATIVNNIGRVNFLRGRLEEAKANYKESFLIRTAFLEDDDIDVAAVLYNMGQVHFYLGSTSETFRHYRRCLDILSKKFGIRHKMVTRILNEIADMHMAQDEVTSAFDYYIQALSSAKDVYGENHTEVASIVYNLGDLCSKKKEFANAILFYSEALDIERSYYEDGHPVIINILDQIARNHQFEGSFVISAETYNEIVKLQRKQKDPDFYQISKILTTIGLLHFHSENYTQSIEVLQEALHTRMRIGVTSVSNQLDISSIVNAIGLVYFKMGLQTLALENFEESLRIRRMLIPNDDDGVSTVLYNIASCLKEMNRLELALKYFKETLDIERAVQNSGREDAGSDVCSTLIQMGQIHQELGSIDDALVCFQEALRYHDSDESEQIVDILKYIGNLNYEKGDFQEARRAYDEASSLLFTPFGGDETDDDDDDDNHFRENVEILSLQLASGKVEPKCAAAA